MRSQPQGIHIRIVPASTDIMYGIPVAGKDFPSEYAPLPSPPPTLLEHAVTSIAASRMPDVRGMFAMVVAVHDVATYIIPAWLQFPASMISVIACSHCGWPGLQPKYSLMLIQSQKQLILSSPAPHCPNSKHLIILYCDGMDHDTCSAFSEPTSALPTPMETSRESSPRVESLVNHRDDHQVPVVEICSGGDMVLNVRKLVSEQGLELGTLKPMRTEGKPLARLRISSAVLRTASRHVKSCLNSTDGSRTTPSGSAKGVALFSTGLPGLWVYMDGSKNLNLLMQSTRTRTIPALITLLRILHLTLDSTRCIKTKKCNVGVMTAMVVEIACALSCVGPVVPWVNLWLTRDLPELDTSDWYGSAEGHYVGIVISYVMRDRAAFERWSELYIQYSRDSAADPVGLGYVWSVINRE